MNKRITSLLLCFVMVFTMLATAVPAFAVTSTCTYTVEADKSTADRGDTITYTVYMQQTTTQNALEFTVDIPAGLTYVANSATMADNLKATLNFDDVAWTESSKVFNGYGAGATTNNVAFAGTAKTKLLTFKCTVDNTAAYKAYSVNLIDLVADDANYDTKNPVAVPATVTVEAAPVAVTGVSLNKTTLNLVAGANETLTAAVAPNDATNKAVTWKSSNEAVATVDATGKVTAVAAGTATITVTTTDGNKSATCTVKVVAAPVAVTGVSLNKATLDLVAGASETLTATVAPTNATNKAVTWKSSNEAVATVVNGKVTAVAAGTATITVTTEDGSKTATCTVTVKNKVTVDDGKGGTTDVLVGAGEDYQLPAAPTAPNTNTAPVFLGWMVNGQLYQPGQSITITGATNITAVWQNTKATVTFKVVNGKWSDDSTTAKTVTINLTNGKGTLASADVPTGMKANSGYSNGRWNVTPNTTANAITDNVTYTYTFTRVGGYTPTTPPTDKPIQSAQTFDAGTALYVGMSILAAAGSAVVIGKKKD